MIFGFIVGREGVFQFAGMFQMHAASGPDDFEFLIEGQERLEEVLFVPEPELVEDPGTGIFCGEEDVMDVHQDSGIQAGQDFQIFVLDVSADFQHMTGIDEEDVIHSQFFKFGERDLLHRGFDETRQSGQAFDQHIPGVGFDGGEITFGVVTLFILDDGLGGEEGGISGADFDDPAGLVFPDHTVEDFGIYGPEIAVAEEVGSGDAGIGFMKGPVFGAVFPAEFAG